MFIYSRLFLINKPSIADQLQEMNRNERKRQLNAELCALPAFVPIQDCQIFRVDRTIRVLVLSHLIDLARITNSYTVDTEKDFYTHQPALIQIEFVGTKSIVLVIQVCHLPHRASSLFWMMRGLFKTIFSSSNRFSVSYTHLTLPTILRV